MGAGRDATRIKTRVRKKPPRKDVTAISAEAMEENGDVFVVLEIHHGLGASTRVDLSLSHIKPLVGSLLAAHFAALSMSPKPGDPQYRCQSCEYTDDEVEFVPTDGRPVAHCCPKCSSTDVFLVSE